MNETLNLKHLLSIAFLSGSPPTRPIWKRVKELLEEVGHSKPEDLMKVVLESSLEHPIAIKFPKNSIHINRFLSWLIDIWKNNQWNGEKKLAKFYCTSTSNESEINYNTYFIDSNNNAPMTLLESNEGISRGTTGLSSWGAARVLASWCCNNHQQIKGKVVELGSGIGFTACSLLSSADALNNISSYTATDYHPHVLSILHHNLTLLQYSEENHSRQFLESFCKTMNDCLEKDELPPGDFGLWEKKKDFLVNKTLAKVRQLDWRNPTQLPICDVVLAADVVYAPHLFTHLSKVVRLLLSGNCKSSKNERKAFVACTRRNQETISDFLAEVRKQNLNYEEVHQSTLDREESLFGFDESHLPIKIYKLTLL